MNRSWQYQMVFLHSFIAIANLIEFFGKNSVRVINRYPAFVGGYGMNERIGADEAQRRSSFTGAFSM